MNIRKTYGDEGDGWGWGWRRGMNAVVVFHVLAWLLGVMGLLMGACGGVSAAYGEWGAARALFTAGGGAIVWGLGMWFLTRRGGMVSWRDGVGIVAFGWVVAGVAGAMPFLLAGTIPDFVSAFFESVSGFTTTGATVLACVEECPRGLLLWRAVTQGVGGGGVLLLMVAVLPLTGAGGMQLYRAEVTGPLKDRIEPRMASTAKMIWVCYGILTGMLLVLLRLGGMTWFDSVCHSLSTISTGGFSTRTASIGAYGSCYIEGVIGVFMLLSGVNFAYYVRVLHGDYEGLVRSTQSRVYLVFFLMAFVVCAVGLCGGGVGVIRGARDSFFTCASLLTSTGFCTADFGGWPVLLQGILLVLMCVGGCAGSTAGGIKVVRVWVFLKALARGVVEFIQPRAVLPLRMDGKPLEDEVVRRILVFVGLYFLVVLVGTLMMLGFTPDVRTAGSAVLSAMGNTGPGLGGVGPAYNYGGVAWGGKLLLTFLMLAGRLELYTMLAVVVPSFWRR